MAKSSLVSDDICTSNFQERMQSPYWILRLQRASRLIGKTTLRIVPFLLLLLAARPAQGQTTLIVDTHWADGIKCGCTITVKQMNADGSTTQVFQGNTDSNGHLSGTMTLLVQGVYSLSVSSNAYGIPLFSLPFSTGLVTALPLKSATLNLVFNRPSVNGQPIACCALPGSYTAPTLASGTSVQFGM